MSWKSLVTASLLCVLASPVFAVPTVSAVGGGTASSNFLDASGNWVWQIKVAPSNPIPNGASPLGTELGFRETSTKNIVGSATANAAVWDTNNPGASIFGWETTDPTANNKPTGLQTHNATDEIFAGLGSASISTTGAGNFISFGVQGPSTSAAATLSTTTVQMLGSYSGKGRIAEGTTGSGTASNYDVFAGSVTFSAKAGDVNLDGTISGGDFAILQQNFNQGAGTKHWSQGDFNGDGSVTGGDFSFMQQNFGAANNYTVVSGGFTNAGSGAGSGLGSNAVPEPASIALLGLCSLAYLFRKRR